MAFLVAFIAIIDLSRNFYFQYSLLGQCWHFRTEITQLEGWTKRFADKQLTNQDHEEHSTELFWLVGGHLMAREVLTLQNNDIQWKQGIFYVYANRIEISRDTLVRSTKIHAALPMPSCIGWILTGTIVIQSCTTLLVKGGSCYLIHVCKTPKASY